jgi:hypothetical protein
MAETLTITIADGDEEETLTAPRELLEALAEGDQSPTEVVGDVAMLSLASRAHHMAHHGEGGDLEFDVEAVESATMELFEERFGVTFEQATGHSH